MINSLAYRAIALDFEIWSTARPEIQRLFFEHFTVLLKTSKYRNFNARQRLGKLGVIRKLLFVLQTDWYGQDMVDHMLDALKCVAQAYWSVTDTIKPMVSYLASNLHEGEPIQLLSEASLCSNTLQSKRVYISFIPTLHTFSIRQGLPSCKSGARI